MNPIRPLDVLTVPLQGINLVEASAGTGKTWAICGLYLRLLIERELTVRQILVVTFTNAATAELRERIRRRILEMREFLEREPAQADDSFIAALSRAIETSTTSRRRAIELLNRALENFDEASIFTIHGFCERALADNPFSAGLPIAMEPVQDDHDLLMEAVNDFWRRHVAADCAPVELTLFLNEQRDCPQRFAKLLERHLAKPLARRRWPDDIDAPLIDIAPLHGLYSHVRQTWLAEKDSIIELLIRSLSSLNGVTYKADAVASGAREWDSLVLEDNPLAAMGKKMHLYRASVLQAKTNKRHVTPRADFFDQADAYLSLRERLATSFSLARRRLLRRLFEEASLQLRGLKLSRQVISFNDMLSNLHERLKNPAYPWLAKSLEERFPAALIDEFQDTDPLQFDIFREIYPDEAASVFVVGDPKQAIYSFRHADLHTYLRAKSWASSHWSLAANQRSSELLVRAINGLFAANPSAFVLSGLDYRDVSPGERRRAVFIDRTESRAPLQLWQLPDGPGGPLHKSRATLAAVRATSAEIARLIEAGARGLITLDGQPLRPRDIAVLVRSRALGGEVKQALASLRVGAVEIARSGVFQAVDAKDLDTVLTAVLSPSRDSLVRAALATDLAGCTAEVIESIAGDEKKLMDWVGRFTEYRNIWFDKGFGVMYRRLLSDLSVAERMLSRPDGERRLTNYRHLGEILQQAAGTHGAPDALLRHLKSERGNESDADAVQLRLESDQNLVQIVTIHACKGLEYPVVFCPFICDGATRFGGKALEGSEYHDESLQPVIDFRQEGERPPDENRRIKAAIQLEQAGENVRLLYVAMTRAVHRCYAVTGTYGKGQVPKAGPQGRTWIKESTCSMLNWLVAGQGMTLETWFMGDRTSDDVARAWQRFARTHEAAVGLSPLPPEEGAPVSGDATPAIRVPAAPTLVIAGGWRLGSYSGLAFEAQSEQAANDHDARASVSRGTPKLPSGLAHHDILRFPRGASAGECIHAVFEGIDFTDPSTWDRAIRLALSRHPQAPPGYLETVPQESLERMLRNLVDDVTHTMLIPGLELCSIPMNRRLTELEFTYPATHLSARELNATLKALDYDVPRLGFGDLKGYLKGFIDLVFEHAGRYFILDWKSNHLGFEASDFGAQSVSRAMSAHGYHLQYLLYSVALDRYLRLRIPGYRYAEHFGGVLYLFVRGVRPTWTAADGSRAGVYFHRPAVEALQRLNEILETCVHTERP